MMNWPEAFSVLFALVGIALLFHGFPNIKIGGTHTTHEHYDREEDL